MEKTPLNSKTKATFQNLKASTPLKSANFNINNNSEKKNIANANHLNFSKTKENGNSNKSLLKIDNNTNIKNKNLIDININKNAPSIKHLPNAIDKNSKVSNKANTEKNAEKTSNRLLNLDDYKNNGTKTTKNNSNINKTSNKNSTVNSKVVEPKKDIKTSSKEIPIDFLNLVEDKIVPETEKVHLLPTSISNKTKTYPIPDDPIQRVYWVFNLFKSNKNLINYVKNAPSRKSSSLEEISKYLNSYSEDVLEKYMLIFTWVAMNIEYDTKSYFSGKISSTDCTAEGVFKNGCGVCSGYSSIFKDICYRLNLNCLDVVGYAKGYGYRKGQAFKETDHEWSIIEINSEWYFVECTWGSGKCGTDHKFNFQFNPFYFLTPPQFLIEDHLPQKPNFQLLKTKFSINQYENMHLYKLSHKFEKIYNNLETFKIISPNFLVINYDGNENKEKIQSIRLLNRGKDMTANLQRLDPKTDQEMKVPDRTFMKIMENDNFEVLYTLPESGYFNLWIFEREKGINSKYDGILSFIIEAKNVEKNDFEFVSTYDFKDYYDLIEPLNRKLKIGSKVDFKIKLPGYSSVAIIQDKDWAHLEIGHLNDIWKGTVEIKHKTIGLYAKKKEGENFSGIIAYDGY